MERSIFRIIVGPLCGDFLPNLGASLSPGSSIRFEIIGKYDDESWRSSYGYLRLSLEWSLP
jgi:hypothetical protein